MTNFVFDEKDGVIRAERMAAREKLEGPRIGDFVRYRTGEVERICGSLTESVQTAPDWAGSYCLHEGGGVSYSGGLNPPIRRDTLALTEESIAGKFWFFHHGETGAHRGVYFTIPCRVFVTTAKYEGYISRF